MTQPDSTTNTGAVEAQCSINNCRKPAPASAPFCRAHSLLAKSREYVADALDAHEHSDGRTLLAEIDAAIRATPTPASEAEVPEGWKLVPIEPTEAMCEAGADNLFGAAHDDWKVDAAQIYRAMLSAVPTKERQDD